MGTTVGNGKYTYEVDDDWQKLPAGWTIPVAAVTVDSRDRVHCFSRSPEHPIIVFDREGNVLSTWGASLFAFPHTIRSDAQDNLWIVDRDHAQMFYFSPSGSLLRTIGARGHRSNTGVDPKDFSSVAYRNVTHGGYGNARVHKFAADGTYLFSWGEPGTAPGQFNLPHGVWIDRRGRVLVCDRENDRVQVFNQDGRLLEIWPTKLIGPAAFYVDADDVVYIPEHNGGLVSILTLDGERLAQWGDPSFRSCHGIWGDSRGDLYVVRPGAWGRPRRVVKYTRVR